MSEWLLARVSSENLIQGYLRETAKSALNNGPDVVVDFEMQEMITRGFVEWCLEEGYAFAAVIK